jgi:hypothetical protein
MAIITILLYLENKRKKNVLVYSDGLASNGEKSRPLQTRTTLIFNFLIESYNVNKGESYVCK